MRRRQALDTQGRGPTRRRQPEAAEQRAIVGLLRTVGCEVWVTGTHRRRGDYQGTMMTPGLPDVIALLPGDRGVLFVEVKAEGGRLRPDQIRFRDACLRAMDAGRGVTYATGGLDAVIVTLIGLGLLKPDQVPYYRLPAGLATGPLADAEDA